MIWHEHPTDAELETFLQGTSPSGSSKPDRVVRHLLSECSSCQQRSRAKLAGPHGHEYGSAFAGAERALSDFFAQGPPPPVAPEVLFDELQSLSLAEQLHSTTNISRFAHPALIELLLENSHAKRYRDADGMLHLANLALLAAGACTAEMAGGERKLLDLRGRAWGNYGNSLRISGRLPEAEKAISTAERHLQSGTGDPPLRARVFEQKTSLRMFQGRYPEAIDVAEEAAEIYREIGQMHNFASALVQKAIACQYAGEVEEAISVLSRAIPVIDPEKNPHLLLAACHNMVLSYIAVDKPEQALSLYFEARDLYKEFDDDLILLRVGWQEGQLLRDLGHVQAAEAALLQARKGFMERNLAHEVALVSLDLAWVYVKQGRVEELKQTVTEAVPIFRALRVGREALAALLQLQHAAGQEQQALELIRLLNSRLAPLARNAKK